MDSPTTFFFFPKKPLLCGGTDRLRTLLGKFCLREVVVCILQKWVLNPCFCGIRLSKESCSSYGPCCCCCAFTESLWITCGARSSHRFSGILTPSWPGEYEISILPMRKLRFVEGKSFSQRPNQPQSVCLHTLWLKLVPFTWCSFLQPRVTLRPINTQSPFSLLKRNHFFFCLLLEFLVQCCLHVW